MDPCRERTSSDGFALEIRSVQLFSLMLQVASSLCCVDCVSSSFSGPRLTLASGGQHWRRVERWCSHLAIPRSGRQAALSPHVAHSHGRGPAGTPGCSMVRLCSGSFYLSFTRRPRQATGKFGNFGSRCRGHTTLWAALGPPCGCKGHGREHNTRCGVGRKAAWKKRQADITLATGSMLDRDRSTRRRPLALDQQPFLSGRPETRRHEGVPLMTADHMADVTTRAHDDGLD